MEVNALKISAYIEVGMMSEQFSIYTSEEKATAEAANAVVLEETRVVLKRL